MGESRDIYPLPAPCCCNLKEIREVQFESVCVNYNAHVIVIKLISIIRIHVAHHEFLNLNRVALERDTQI